MEKALPFHLLPSSMLLSHLLFAASLVFSWKHACGRSLGCLHIYHGLDHLCKEETLQAFKKEKAPLFTRYAYKMASMEDQRLKKVRRENKIYKQSSRREKN